MERERLNHLMQDPTHVAKEDLAGLEELTTRYPWFSAAHLLLAVGEHAAGEVLYDERARTAAAHLPQRSVLFDLVHQEMAIPANHPPVVEPPLVPTWVASPVSEVPAPPLPAPVIVAPAIAALPLVQVPEPAPPAMEIPVVPTALIAPSSPIAEIPVALWPVVEPAPEVPAAPVSNALPIETIDPEASETGPLPPLEVEPALSEVDPLDALIRQAAFAGTYELLLENEVEAAPAPTELPSAPEAEVERTKAAAQVAPAPIGPPSHTGKLRFLDWLEQAEHREAVPVQSVGPAPSDWLRTEAPTCVLPPATPPALPALTPAAPTEAVVAKPKVGLSMLEAASLIDSFIRQEHPEPPKRTEFFNPQTAAKRSLEEHGELVTETLAKIYEKQGNTGKALAAYRKLAERHPERKDHFLGLARALEGKGKA